MYICANLSAIDKVIRNISDTSFAFTERLLGKILLPPGAILHGLVSILIDNSFSCDYNFSLRFLRGMHNSCDWYAFT